jgi:hypothetical protein
MVTKEIIKSEIERVPEDRLEELYEVVKIYSRTETETANNGGSLCFPSSRRYQLTGPLTSLRMLIAITLEPFTCIE